MASLKSLRYSVHSHVYLDQLPYAKLVVERAQTAASIEIGAGELLSSDSADESPQPRPSVHKHGSLHGARAMAENLVTKATTFLAGPLQAFTSGLGTAIRTGVKVPTISITSFNSQSSYISSDNNSEMEVTDIRKELQSLQEKHLKEISELQNQEIKAFYCRLGKLLPPNLGTEHPLPVQQED